MNTKTIESDVTLMYFTLSNRWAIKSKMDLGQIEEELTDQLSELSHTLRKGKFRASKGSPFTEKQIESILECARDLGLDDWLVEVMCFNKE